MTIRLGEERMKTNYNINLHSHFGTPWQRLRGEKKNEEEEEKNHILLQLNKIRNLAFIRNSFWFLCAGFVPAIRNPTKFLFMIFPFKFSV